MTAPIDLRAAFAELMTVTDDTWRVESEPTEKKRGRKPGTKMPPRTTALGAAVAPPMTATERKRRQRSAKKKELLENIAILDMETDPFDDTEEIRIEPFLAVLYTRQTEPVVIWENNVATFVAKVVDAIEQLPGAYTIYAHNGGKFDYLFLVSKLRGAVSFKGRGIMQARIGRHELRDSFHIIPERLANWQKDKFDYTKLKRGEREKNKAEIIRYCVNDCDYLLQIVTGFIDALGMKLTIGQAAKAEIKKAGIEVGRFYDGEDAYMRQWFFGGRVECLQGRGEFVGDYKLYDVNSLYPRAMAAYLHPVGSWASYSMRVGQPNDNTVFLDLSCRNNGALIGRGPSGETTATIREGRFKTTIWEYRVALKYGLISDVKIHLCIDCTNRATFADFVLPHYAKRETITKPGMAELKARGLENSPAFFDLKKDDFVSKYLLNNGYGIWAINPRNFTEDFITDPDELPPVEWFASVNKIEDEGERAKWFEPAFRGQGYWLWKKPNPGMRFNNVGTAASITGAARSILLDGLQNAVGAIYCDTDSIICKELHNVPISKTELGAWDLENEFSRIIINGKKLYSVWLKQPRKLPPEAIAKGDDPRYVVKSKGVSRLTWAEMDCLLHGMSLGVRNPAPTMDRYGKQTYIKRTIRATAPILTGVTP